MTLQPGQQLFTRDGRKVGNAIVTGVSSGGDERGALWQIETDYGNTADRLSSAEVQSLWYFLDISGEPRISDIAEWRESRAEKIPDLNARRIELAEAQEQANNLRLHLEEIRAAIGSEFSGHDEVASILTIRASMAAHLRSKRHVESEMLALAQRFQKQQDVTKGLLRGYVRIMSERDALQERISDDEAFGLLQTYFQTNPKNNQPHP